MSTRTLRLATRGSALARRQAETIKQALEGRRVSVELVEVETTGDMVRDELIHRLGKTGAFVRSLDEDVLSGNVDAAVHSMKDMPTESPDELIVAGIPERADPGDVLITPNGTALEDLPEGAIVGTSSLRRRAQVLSARADLTVEPLRGNVDTRIEKLLAPSLQREHQRRLDAEEDADVDPGHDDADEIEENEDIEFDQTADEWFVARSTIEQRAMERRPEMEYDAIVLAAAGLKRVGLLEQVGSTPLPDSSFVPAPGQGAIAVTAVEDSDASQTINDAIDHPRTRVETTVERVVLDTLGGGCVAPIGVHAVVKGEYVHVDAAVFDREGDQSVEGHRNLPVERYVETARDFAGELRDRGAAELIAAASADAEEREAKRE